MKQECYHRLKRVPPAKQDRSDRNIQRDPKESMDPPLSESQLGDAVRVCFGDAKFCPNCGEIKNLSAFSRRAAAKDGRASHCKKCHSLIGKAYYKDKYSLTA